MRDNLSGLSALLLVADKKSFTAAAAELRVTRSALSMTIRALEERVGVRLVQRTTRSVGLTEAGARFVGRVRPALGEVQRAFASLEASRDQPAGQLRISVPRFAFAYVLRPRLGAFLAAYPDITVDLCIDDGVPDLVRAGFDAGIRLGESIDREMIAVRVSDDESMAVVGSPAYFAGRSKPKHPRELAAHDCINYRYSDGDPLYRWEFTERGRDFEIAVEGRVLVNDREAMTLAAIDGLGLAYVAASRVREQVAEHRLVRVLDDYCPPFPGLFLYYPSRANVAPKLQALVDFMRRRPRGRARRQGAANTS